MKWFRNWVKSMDIYEKFGFLFGAIFGLFIGIFIFCVGDITPATAADYAPMENQIQSIEKNKNLLLTQDCKITVKDNIITVYLQNEECKLIATFNQDLELLSTSKEDNYMFWLLALILCLLIGFSTFGFSSFIFSLLFLLIFCFIEKFKSNKTKRKNN